MVATSAASPGARFGAHIVLESSRDEQRTARRPKSVVERFELKSLFRGTRTRLTLYQEGFLAVQTELGRLRRKELTLDLRYLDARPSVARTGDVRLLYPAGGAAALAVLLVALAGFGALSPLASFASAFVLAVVSAAITWRFLYGNGELAVFRTARGHGEVLELFASIGESATLRRIVPAIVAGIRAAAEPSPDTQTYLREEMREHYRLAQSGVLSEDECTTCTQRILQQFQVAQAQDGT
jgi:hypothetical protein